MFYFTAHDTMVHSGPDSTILRRFFQIWFSNFCGEQANASEILNQFFNQHKREGKLKKTGDVAMFYIRF